MPGFLPKHERVVESRGFLDITRLPETMLVVGGGFIGCELACMAAMLGTKVTIVELLEDILLLLDPDVRREVRAHMEKSLGIRVLTGKALEKVAANDKGVSGNFGDEALKADLLLSAIGRRRRRCSVALAIPKSITLGTGTPSCMVTMMFDGLRSRWMIPFWWACWTALQT